ncbi:beta-Ala-His dipeptidase [Spirochaeta dissipatitropha]
MTADTRIYNERTETVLAIFSELAQIPRPSHKEDKIRSWLQTWANDNGFSSRTDSFGNICIYIPASPGCEAAPVLVLQGHMDMVCENLPEVAINFDIDPIPLVREDEWLRAAGTTLGADNGIAIAMALAFALDTEITRPALEILITVEEETGLTGARELDPSLISGKILLNIDSEDEGVLTVGCAGGIDSNITVPISRVQETASNSESSARLFILQAGGMLGGHSGVDAHEIRANAVRMIARVLWELQQQDINFDLHSVHGGNAHNAIPRDAFALISIDSLSELPRIQPVLESMQEDMRKEFMPAETGLFLNIQSLDTAASHLQKLSADNAARPAIDAESSRRLIRGLLALPHGPEKFSGQIPGLVETSCNLATVRCAADTASILLSQRSSLEGALHAMTERIRAVAELLGAEAKNPNSYPPWEPDFNSSLLKRAKDCYVTRFGKEPIVETIHAGLECGVIGAKIPGMEMISIGPTIKNPHSPDECLDLPSLEKTITFTVDLLESYAK